MAKLELKKLLKRADSYTSFNSGPLFGFALESAKGKSAIFGFQFNVKDQYIDPETKTLVIQNIDPETKTLVIQNILDDLVYPEIMHRVHNGTLLPSYQPTRVHIILNTRSPNKILLDNEAHFSANFVLKHNKDLKGGELIEANKIKKITKIFPSKNHCDDCAHIMLIKFNGRWLGCVDLTFDRLKIKRKMKAAREYLESAKQDLEHQRWSPFVTNIWRFTELSVQSLLLFRFQGGFSTHQDHNKTKKIFEELCMQNNIPNKFWVHYKYLFYNYKSASYVQGIDRDFTIDKQTAQKLLATSEEMLYYVIKTRERIDQNLKPSGERIIKF